MNVKFSFDNAAVERRGYGLEAIVALRTSCEKLSHNLQKRKSV